MEHGGDPVVYMAQQRVCQLTAAICRRGLLAEPSLFCAVGTVIAPERKSLRQEPPQQPEGKHRQQQGGRSIRPRMSARMAITIPMRSEILLQKRDSFFISVATFQK